MGQAHGSSVRVPARVDQAPVIDGLQGVQTDRDGSVGSKSSSSDNDDVCGICMRPWSAGRSRNRPVAVRTPCGHEYCVDCVANVIKHGIEQGLHAGQHGGTIPCPYCRQNVFKEGFAVPALANEAFCNAILLAMDLVEPCPDGGGPRIRGDKVRAAVVQLAA